MEASNRFQLDIFLISFCLLFRMSISHKGLPFLVEKGPFQWSFYAEQVLM